MDQQRMEIAPIPVIARVTSTSATVCHFYVESSRFMPMHTPTMTLAPLTPLGVQSGTPAFISHGYLSCHTWICA
jgi:hypothetical protein